MNKRILVTGATGFVGRALCTNLDAQGYQVRAAVRQKANSNAEDVDVGEIGADTDWTHALVNIYAVVHCAACTNIMSDKVPTSLQVFRRVNTEGTLNLAKQAVAFGVKRFVFVSTVKVNGEATEPGNPFTADDVPAPNDFYSLSKYEAEIRLMSLAQETGLEVVIVRPPLVYGPMVKGNFESLMHLIGLSLPLPFGAIRNSRSMVYLDNLVSLLIVCINHPAAPGQTFLVSDGEDVSTTELLIRARETMGKKIFLLPVPTPVLKLVAALLGKSAMAQRICGSLQVDISKTCVMLNWKPPVSLNDGLRSVVKENL